MADITLTAGVRQNLLSLQNTANLMALTQNRLATGKKVNSALDNPISFFTSQSLNDRASDLSSLLDSISNATQTLQAANNGLTSLTKLVQSAQAIAQQATTSAVTTATRIGSVAGLTGSFAGTFTAGKTIIVGGATFTAAGDATDTVQRFIDAVNAGSTTVKASLTSEGKIQLQSNSAAAVVITGSAEAATQTAQFGLANDTTTGSLNATRTSLATQFDTIRSQIDQLAADSGYNGVNLLNGDSLKVVFNEKGTSTQSISGVKFDATGLGIAASTHSFQVDGDVTAALTNLTAALATLRSQAANFGSSLSVVQTRQDFTKAMVNTLQTGADNLVLADSNQEGANMLALQTRQSLSTTALSLANQASQAVLRLFQ
jgi:flagellin-like hook-associated protein FlgL